MIIYLINHSWESFVKTKEYCGFVNVDERNLIKVGDIIPYIDPTNDSLMSYNEFINKYQEDYNTDYIEIDNKTKFNKIINDNEKRSDLYI